MSDGTKMIEEMSRRDFVRIVGSRDVVLQHRLFYPNLIAALLISERGDLTASISISC